MKGACVALLLLLGARAWAQQAPQGRILRVTWQQALNRALARNPSAIVAIKEIDKASGLVLQARALWLPTLNGNGIFTRLDRDRVFNGMVATPANQWNGNLAATVPLLAPTAWAGDRQARDAREVTRLQANDVRRQLAEAVGRAYLTVLLGHRQLEVARRATETSRSHYDFAHTRLVTGLGNAVDDARAEQELRTDQAAQDNTVTALIRAQSALAVLLSEEDLVDVVDEVDLPAAPAPADAIARGRADRADVKVLAGQQTATANLRRDIWTYYAPMLVAQLQAFKQTKTLLTPEQGWQALIVLQLPLFDGGARFGIQAVRRAADEEAQVQLDAQLRQVALEVRTAFTVVRNADEALAAARAAAVAATAAAKLADQSYRAGNTTNLEVIDAVRQARDAETRVAIAEHTCRQARLDLVLATGAFP
jgi:outer membrane protein TolC